MKKINKNKVLAIAAVLGLGALTIGGGSLAYFTDKTEVADNEFAFGNVDIDLLDEFPEDVVLLPATGSAQAGTLQNGVSKLVDVKNTGKSDAYVRVHIAIPNILDDGDSTFDAKNNVLHFNYASESVGEGLWDWSNATGAPYEGQWNYYEITLDGIKYNVYVVTYESKLAKNQTTAQHAIHQIYLDKRVTSSDAERINTALNGDAKIKVIAEAAQADGFDDAYAALNTAFGVPGTYNPFN